MASATQPPRATFARTVLVGLASSVLGAVAATQTWLSAKGDAVGAPVFNSISGSELSPLTGALSLVVLAAWGVLLVTRGWVRQAVAAIGFVAAVGAVVAAVIRVIERDDLALLVLRERGAISLTSNSIQAWTWVCIAALVVAGLTLGYAVPKSRVWPAMGSRYDAPGSADQFTSAGAERSDLELWKSFDEGVDPTDDIDRG